LAHTSSVNIIGSGVAGLATGIRLATKGYRVKVFEAEQHPGGKLSEFSIGPYRFDFGPSLFTMPQYVDELFETAGLEPRDHFHYRRLETTNNYFYPDGTRIRGFADPRQFAEEAAKIVHIPPERILRHLKKSEYIHTHTSDVFLNRSLHKADTYLRWSTAKSFVRLPAMGVLNSMHEANHKTLREPHLVQLFDRFATYNGSNPYRAPEILNVIPSLEHIQGAYFPQDGMISITNSMVRLAERLGVDIHLNERVESIEMGPNRVKGVTTAKQFYPSDVVVSNSDIVPTYRYLLKNQKAPKHILNQERSSSAIVFYWGIDRTFAELELHNIFFSADYQKEFDTMFGELTIDSDPTVYIHISSKEKSDDAPLGHENWFVMVNAPYNDGQDWDTIIDSTRKHVVQKINSMLQCDIENHIREEEILDPRKIESKTSSYKGSLYGTSSNNRMAAFFRHPNFSKDIRGLFFCGGSVHPGGGIPLCLLSAKITSNLISA
jgi:phytoene desaturase